jgi:hypothetical protein
MASATLPQVQTEIERVQDRKHHGGKKKVWQTSRACQTFWQGCYFAGAGVGVVAAVEAATFFALFLLLFLLCFLLTLLVVVAVFSGAFAASWAANAVPRTIAAPIIKAENLFMSVSFSFWGFFMALT